MIHFEPTLDFARKMDAQDPLASFRKEFLFPLHLGHECLYFCGNSLGLQPRAAKAAIDFELNRWETLGVEGHFLGDLPWTHFHKALAPATAHVVGAKESEVIVMNTLTVNLHLLMVSFYRPTAQRYKIIMEAGAFPSDQYAIASQVQWHGFDPASAIVEVTPRPGEDLLRPEDILALIEKEGPHTALVLFGGLNYFTGQVYDLPAITKAGHEQGAMVGFDLAHAAGNIPLQLHEWGVDFAVWCTYKYMNSGPGALGGAFVHEKHDQNNELPRLKGWWGHDEGRRFLMEKNFQAIPGAAGWQMSNPPILAMAPMKASHALFLEAGMERLRAKSLQLTGYLEFLIDGINSARPRFEILSPRDPQQRGAQLSIITGPEGKALFDYLAQNGVICDWRENNLPSASVEKTGVIRLAPAPLYNSFEDVWQVAELMRKFGGQ
jgi:kynureninase